jgi:hypothetical protein
MSSYFQHSLQSTSSFAVTDNSGAEAKLGPCLVTAHHHLFTGNPIHSSQIIMPLNQWVTRQQTHVKYCHMSMGGWIICQ